MAFTRIILDFTYFYEGNADSNSEVIVHNWILFSSFFCWQTIHCPKSFRFFWFSSSFFDHWMFKVYISNYIDDLQVADEIISELPGIYGETEALSEVQLINITIYFIIIISNIFALWKIIQICSKNEIPTSQFDEKNIRRRIYDALNVLMAMDIIIKEKKQIQWKGLPDTKVIDLEGIKVSGCHYFFITWVLDTRTCYKILRWDTLMLILFLILSGSTS